MSAAAATNQVNSMHVYSNVAEIQLARQKEEERLLAKYQAQKEVIKRTVAKDASDEELHMLFALAARYNLDPFLKQIWFVKGMGVICGRDSYITTMNRHPDYRGMVAHVVCENDEFVFDAATNTVVKHVITGNRGAPLGAYSILKREGRTDSFFWASMAEYKKGTPAWNTNPSAMIIKCSISNNGRLQFPIEGMQFGDPEDFNLGGRPEAMSVVDQNIGVDTDRIALPPAGAIPAKASHEAFGYGFRKWPEDGWFDEKSTIKQVQQIGIESNAKHVPEDLRQFTVHAVLSAIGNAPAIDLTDESPCGTKHLNKAQASLAIDFFKNATEESISQAMQAAQDLLNLYEAENSAQ